VVGQHSSSATPHNFDVKTMDARWYKFAELCRSEFLLCGFQEQLISECFGHEDVAWVVFFHLQEQALNWLQSQVPALENRIPISLIETGSIDEVRRCLWSMPC